MMTKPKLTGYRRGNRWGVRNHLVVISSVGCVNSLVTQIAMGDRTIVPITHPNGCGHMDQDRLRVLNTMVNTCSNPNVGAVLVIGLGCENITSSHLVKALLGGGQRDQMIRSLDVQEVGEKEDLFELALKTIAEMKEFLAAQRREEFALSELTLAMKCGGSDIFSGITANPVVGRVSDKLVGFGGTVVLSELPEMIGAEGALARKIDDPEMQQRLFDRIQSYVDLSKKMGTDLRGVNPTPGNIAGGISSIEEKSLGCITKGGASPVRDFVDYGQIIQSRGLVIMDTPGNDTESVCGMVAGGAQIVLFTTGRGTPYGHPVAPTLKISTNNRIFAKMRSFLDFNAGEVLEGASLDKMGDELFDLVVETVNGRECRAEVNLCREFAVTRVSGLL